jgi:hypothetical protein
MSRGRPAQVPFEAYFVQVAKLLPYPAAYAPAQVGTTRTAAVVGGGVMVTVLPGGTTTVVPDGPGVTTVGGDALGAGTITVGGGGCC